MKRVIVYFFYMVLFFSCTSGQEIHINLIPKQLSQTANYRCTWYAQNYWVQHGGKNKDLTALTNPKPAKYTHPVICFTRTKDGVQTTCRVGKTTATFWSIKAVAKGDILSSGLVLKLKNKC